MVFNSESEFEEALIKLLSEKGWEKKVLKNYSEKDLLRNWADILFENNRGIDRLNDYPLTDTEMQQILEQIENLRTPLKLNGFINGKSVSITRDNPDDKLHYGKEVSLKIYDRREIAAGQSRYQIVQQPKFPTKSKILNDRRGDLMLLINGMPVIHIELKKSGVPVSDAYHQIEKYSREGVFTGLFSLVQIFVAMEPNETVYFANPGPDGQFNKNYYFHWADFNNEPINEWDKIVSTLLSIPMAHQLIGFYTVADNSDGVLKVMRSYQYFAANAISDKVAQTNWNGDNQLGGYIWHTTGSGKTMTSFKSAQLIAASKDADKVIFLMDRIELGTQSLKEYRGFASENEGVQATENTGVLIAKLKSTEPSNTLIVTSIQKMSNIKNEPEGLNSSDIESMSNKRIVFIIDEAHRSTFGDMLITIKKTFPKAIFFGFTGTPIQEENQKKNNTTSTVFGNELHRYSIADGIRDKNVLGFDPYKVLTFRDRDIRQSVALEKAKAQSEEEAISDPQKAKVYYKYMASNEIRMAGHTEANGRYVKGIEDYVPMLQYQTNEHVNSVVNDILENWVRLSRGGKFHAIFATSSIPEAIVYYRKLKELKPDLKVTALFDPNIDNSGNIDFKEDGLSEIIKDYNKRYDQNFAIPTFSKMKKDISARLSHKKPYQRLTTAQQIDLLIVVDQMLTGFDSKWINTLYMDKMLQYENIIQAFSRTNRLFGDEKPFGTIRYYRKPHTMERNIEDAVKLYSGDKPLGLFVQHIIENIENMNRLYKEISDLFIHSGIKNFEKIPDDKSVSRKFAKLFSEFKAFLEAAKIQGVTWERKTYKDESQQIKINFTKTEYYILSLRYQELYSKDSGDGIDVGKDIVPYDISSYITELDTGVIDADYMNSRFSKYLKLLNDSSSSKAISDAEEELHKTFATLTQEEQKFANIFLHEIQRGEVEVSEDKTFRDYITEYIARNKNDQIHNLAENLGLDEEKLRYIMNLKLNEANINEFGRYSELKDTVDKKKAKDYLEKIEGKKIIPPKVGIKVDKLLREFIISGGFDIEVIN